MLCFVSATAASRSFIQFCIVIDSKRTDLFLKSSQKKKHFEAYSWMYVGEHNGLSRQKPALDDCTIDYSHLFLSFRIRGKFSYLLSDELSLRFRLHSCDSNENRIRMLMCLCKLYARVNFSPERRKKFAKHISFHFFSSFACFSFRKQHNKIL